MSTHEDEAASDRGIFCATVVSNASLCDEHYRVRLRLPRFPAAAPGQFVHLLCHSDRVFEGALVSRSWGDGEWPTVTEPACVGPTAMLRRAFSIAELAREDAGVTVDVIHRVVGLGTAWLLSLRRGDTVNVLGPLGNAFPILPAKPSAYLVSGGVGFPPMIWLARALREAGKAVVSFFGAQTRRLVPLGLPDRCVIPDDARRGCDAAPDFARVGVPVVLSTDDGSVGFRGLVTEALARFAEANPAPPEEVVVYTCGPEPMMRAVAAWCDARGVECHVCMEREMACGMGTCQSCVVACHDETHPTGQRYRLCCTDGPIFDSRDIIWE